MRCPDCTGWRGRRLRLPVVWLLCCLCLLPYSTTHRVQGVAAAHECVCHQHLVRRRRRRRRRRAGDCGSTLCNPYKIVHFYERRHANLSFSVSRRTSSTVGLSLSLSLAVLLSVCGNHCLLGRPSCSRLQRRTLFPCRSRAYLRTAVRSSRDH